MWTWRSWPVWSSWVLSWFQSQPAQQVVPAFWVWCRAQSNTDPSPRVTAASGSPDRWLTEQWVALCWSGYHRCTGPPLQCEPNTHLEPIKSTTQLSIWSYNDCPLSTGSKQVSKKLNNFFIISFKIISNNNTTLFNRNTNLLKPIWAMSVI